MARAFGTAGVRGVFNRTQTPEQVYRLAETVAFAFGRGRYAVGWDGRKASALLSKTVLASVSAAGSEAISLGLVPTPVVAYSAVSRSCLAAFSVTASHNPVQFSGVKVFNREGMELPKQDEERVERAMAVSVMKSSGLFGQITSDEGATDDYVEALAARHELNEDPLRIAIDCATGPGGLVTPRVLKRLGNYVVPVNSQVSWRFPARPPEPTAANLADFMRVVPTLGVDFAFAHDGDADRLVMLDGLGNIVPDSVVAILALRALGETSGTVVISENASTAVAEEAERLGLRVVRSRVGKTFAVLREGGGVFATEPSKIVEPKWGFWEDGINAAALISSLLARERSLLASVVAENPWKYRQVNLEVQVRMQALETKARDVFKRMKVKEERRLDGYKLVFSDDSWVMFRASGTEPLTRIYCESRDQQTLDTLVQQCTQCVESSNTA